MAKVEVADLSGSDIPVTANPYNAILEACRYDSGLIQQRYELHRATRNRQQKSKILSDDFSGWILDDVLLKLQTPKGEMIPNVEDTRNCLVFWARPPIHIRQMIECIQSRLRAVMPDIWIMPANNLHMTTLEVTHSLTAAEIDAFVQKLKLGNAHREIADWTFDHRAILIKPAISYDAAACALSFVPAAHSDYTYHQLRRDVYQYVTEAGVPVESRYVVPSAHLTIARFNSPNIFGGDIDNAQLGKTIENRHKWIATIEQINEDLKAKFWYEEDADSVQTARSTWIVGCEKGLDFRKGTLWYGGGETVYLGKGFEEGSLTV